ncbi:MAG: sulfur carrier protein ThiS [Alphaproteobacteria bacterium]|nr:sulfur carrier protein ThiS [Alphaproteobacteria bacterium]
MTVRVNGAAHEIEPGTTLLQLLEALGIRREGVAVAVRRQVVPRGEHARRELHDGDEIEVLRAVGGG